MRDAARVIRLSGASARCARNHTPKGKTKSGRQNRLRQGGAKLRQRLAAHGQRDGNERRRVDALLGAEGCGARDDPKNVVARAHYPDGAVLGRDVGIKVTRVLKRTEVFFTEQTD
jgi:hypothetical protein